MSNVYVLQVLGAQLQSLCEKRSFVAQLKTDFQETTNPDDSGKFASSDFIYVFSASAFFKSRKIVSVKGKSWMICKGLM